MLDGIAPGLVIHGLELPQRRVAHAQIGWTGVQNAVNVTTDTSTCHGEAKLTALDFARVQVKPGHAQPADGQVFQRVAHLEDAQ